jgi:hypothetical protein
MTFAAIAAAHFFWCWVQCFFGGGAQREVVAAVAGLWVSDVEYSCVLAFAAARPRDANGTRNEPAV